MGGDHLPCGCVEVGVGMQEIYPEFSITTDAVISFNDKYDNVEKIEVFDDLEQDLSTLGESLAKRIELEDQLCEVMK